MYRDENHLNGLYLSPMEQSREKLEKRKGIDQVKLILWSHQNFYCKGPSVPGPGIKPVQCVVESECQKIHIRHPPPEELETPLDSELIPPDPDVTTEKVCLPNVHTWDVDGGQGWNDSPTLVRCNFWCLPDG